MIKLVRDMTAEKLTKIRKLDLGSGKAPAGGYIHMDILPFCPHVEIVGDLRGALPLMDGQLDVLRASHVIEHVPGYCRALVLREWCRVVKRGGKLKVITPNLRGAVAAHRLGKITSARFYDILYGGQFNEYATHFYCFTPDRLKEELLAAGFSAVTIDSEKDSQTIYAEATK